MSDVAVDLVCLDRFSTLKMYFVLEVVEQMHCLDPFVLFLVRFVVVVVVAVESDKMKCLFRRFSFASK